MSTIRRSFAATFVASSLAACSSQPATTEPPPEVVADGGPSDSGPHEAARPVRRGAEIVSGAQTLHGGAWTLQVQVGNPWHPASMTGGALRLESNAAVRR